MTEDYEPNNVTMMKIDSFTKVLKVERRKKIITTVFILFSITFCGGFSGLMMSVFIDNIFIQAIITIIIGIFGGIKLQHLWLD